MGVKVVMYEFMKEVVKVSVLYNIMEKVRSTGNLIIMRLDQVRIQLEMKAYRCDLLWTERLLKSFFGKVIRLTF